MRKTDAAQKDRISLLPVASPSSGAGIRPSPLARSLSWSSTSSSFHGGASGSGATPPSRRATSTTLACLGSRRGVAVIVALALLMLLLLANHAPDAFLSGRHGFDESTDAPPTSSSPSTGNSAAPADLVKYFGALTSSVCNASVHASAIGLPPVEYGIMIDAGSTGSRVHVYRFNHCASRALDVEHEVFEQRRPGLSAFAADPVKAAASLRPLLEIARQAVPQSMHSCTGVQVKATAGLRLLGRPVANAILSSVRELITRDFPFPLVNSAPSGSTDDAVEIMEGADEGVFAWVTINSLLDTVRAGGHTAAIMDLGGASTQIVFAPADPRAIPTTYRTTTSYSGQDHVLYQHSYLGYGLKEALKSVRLFAVQNSTHGSPIAHPCYAKGYSTSVDVLAQNRSVVLRGDPNPDACDSLVTAALFPEPSATRDAKWPCREPPCSWKGVHHPAIPVAAPIFAFSYFYDLLDNVLSVTNAFGAARPEDGSAATDSKGRGQGGTAPAPPGSHTTTLEQLGVLQRVACSDPSVLDAGEAAPEVAGHPARAIMADLAREDPDYCAAVTYLGALLHGYKIDRQRPVTVMKKIRGFEMGWCLGATMSMLDSSERIGGRCKAP